MTPRFCIKDGYQARSEPQHVDNLSHAESDTIRQSDIYALAAFLGGRYGADTIIDVGFSSAPKPASLDGFYKLDINFATDLDRSQTSFSAESRIEVDRLGAVAIDDVRGAVVVCAGLIERIVDPIELLSLLRELSDSACVVLLATPERDLMRGPADRGPPADPSHIREWNLREFECLLREHGLSPTFTGLTVGNDRNREKKTILSVIDRSVNSILGQAPEDFRPLALIAAYNDGDIILQSALKLLNDGFDVRVLDNWSDDGSYEALVSLRDGRPALSVERFPADAPVPHYEWAAILQAKDQIAQRYPGRWIVHQDSDEIRDSPWADVSFRQGLWIADRMGFNAVDFTVCDFRPTDDTFRAGDDPEQTITKFEFGRRPGHFVQIKAWKQGSQPVLLAASGGHEAVFPGRRIFPYKFLLKHYPLRSPEQARKKIFKDRIARFSPQERAKGWHVQYDHWKPDDPFLWSNALIDFDRHVSRRNYLVELISGIGVVI